MSDSDRSSGGADQQCYHYDCDRDATRKHYSSMNLKSDPQYCCDEHNPMAATEKFVRLGTEETQDTSQQEGLDAFAG